MKVSPTRVKSVAPSLNVGNAYSKSNIDSHWLPIATTLTIMDPNIPEHAMKFPISIDQNSMQYHTSVLMDSATTLNFVSLDILTRNDLLGKCIRGPKIVVRIANE